ncbi:CHAT domain-containing protein [Calothrix sp. FACHB-156]|nr:CHAT domain-containing protein [Calothrix sp. FACHB-156]
MKLRHLFKYLFIGIVGLYLVVSQPQNILAQVNGEVQKQNQAQLLTQKGTQQLNLGQAAEALTTWKEATKIYRQLQHYDGIVGSLINQSLALQALGLQSRACNTLLEALNLNITNNWICNTSLERFSESRANLLLAAIDKQATLPVHLLGLQNLGNVLRRLGKLSESKIILEKTLSLAQQTSFSDLGTVFLSLGNTEKDMYKQLRDKYIYIEEPLFRKEIFNLIQQKALKSLDIYQQATKKSNTSQGLQLQSQLEYLKLLLDFETWLNLESKSGNVHIAELLTKIHQQIQPLANLILKNDSAFLQLPISQYLYAKLNFANSLNQIPNPKFHSVATEYAKSVLQKAQSINNERLQSYSLGTLGKLQTEQAETYFIKALNIAQSVQNWDLAYQWQQQLGELYQKQRKYDKALNAYSEAIENLTQVRNNLLSTNIELQFSFYEKVEPVYRNYVRLLLETSNPNLEKVIQANEQLQIAELENFLQCGKLNFMTLNQVTKNNTTTVVHIINLDNHVEVIVQSSDHQMHRHSVNAELIQNSVESFLQTLQDDDFVSTEKSVIISYSQTIYNHLIAPIRKYLPSSGTLVFTLDKSFQSIPMGLLHDGENYLLKNYSIATTLGSRIRPLKALGKEQLKALIAGLSKPSPSLKSPNTPQGLKALPEAEQEALDVRQQTKGSAKLLNENFTSDRFQQELKTANFPIVHVTTHGQFSSDPQRTILLAWDRPINVREFDGWLKTQQNQDPIELLVLSACQTAKGNKRSTLGIAGVAAQAGARTTVASLWQVDAKSTVLLVEEFYKGLNNNLTKAEALRLAQLHVLSNPEYQHPYYWAGFVLVGSWL